MASIINVSAGGDVQAAIDGANPGDVIQLAAGTYSGFTVDKDVTVRGPNAALPGAAPGRLAEATVEGQIVVTGSGATVTGLEVADYAPTTNAGGEAIRVSGGADNVTIENNVVRDIDGDGLPIWESMEGIVAYGGSASDPVTNVTIRGNLVEQIDGRDTEGGAAGIRIQGNVDGADVSGNTVRNIGMSDTAWAFGIAVSGTGNHAETPANVSLTGNTIADILSNPATPTVGVGIGLESPSDAVTVSGNSVSNAAFLLEDKEAAGVTVSTSELEALIAGNTLDKGVYVTNSDGTIDTTASGAVIVFSSIQAAVDSAENGDTINVLPGTYREQVEIDGFTDLTLRGTGDGVVIESPDDPVFINSTNTSRDRAAVVSVEDGTDITIEGITVDGRGQAGNMPGGNRPDFEGIFFGNSSGKIDDVTVVGVRDPLNSDGTPSGNQRGNAILVANDDGVARTVDVTNSDLSDFQKTGLVAQGDGLTVNVDGNTVTGAGFLPAPNAIAQNGIQISDGAGGTVTNNVVSEIGYQRGDFITTSVLGVGAADGLTITGNTFNGVVDGNGDPIPSSHFAVVVFGETDDAVVTGNTFDGVLVGISAFGNVDEPDFSGNTFQRMVSSVTTNTPSFEGGNTIKGEFIELFGGENDAPLSFVASEGPDLLFGTPGADSLDGSGGDDFLFGDGGDDTLDGGAGTDTVLGGVRDGTTIALSDDSILLDGEDTVRTVEIIRFDDGTTLDAPNAVAPQTATEEQAITIDLADLMGLDAADFTFDVTGTARSWLTLDPDTGVLEGTPDDGDPEGTLSVTATETDGVVVTHDFEVAIDPVNDPPELSGVTDIATDEDTRVRLSWDGGVLALVASDVDVADGGDRMRLTLEVADGAGTFDATRQGLSGDITITGAGTNTLVIETGGDANGSRDAAAILNSLLRGDNASEIGFTPAADANGPVEVSFTLSDLGNTGAGGVKTDIGSFTIDVAPVNDAPTDIDLTDTTVPESTYGATVGTLSTEDVDLAREGDSHTYTIAAVRDADGQSVTGLFEIDDDTLKLADGKAADFEENALFEVDITSTDSGTPAASLTETFQITVEDRPYGPDWGEGFELVSVDDWYNPDWGGGFTANFRYTIQPEDVVDGTVEAWTIDPGYDGPGTITTGWSGFGPVSFGDQGDGFVISTVDQAWQRTAEPGDVIEFSLQVQGAGYDEDAFAFDFSDEDPAPADPGGALALEANTTWQWQGNFGQSVSVTNEASDPADGWTVKLDLDAGEAIQLDQLWGANAEKVGGDWLFTAKSWNGTLAPGQSANFGFNATNPNGDVVPFDADDFSFV